MNNSNLNEKLFDDILEFACKEESERIGGELPEESELSDSIPISNDFEKKMQALFKHEKTKLRKKSLFKTFKITAACILAVVILNLSLLIGVEAYRFEFFNMCIDVKKEFTTFFFEESELGSQPAISDIPDAWNIKYAPAYLPEGFSITNANYDGEIKKIFYSNNDNTQTIIYDYSPIKSTTFALDTEDSTTSKISISGYEGYIMKKETDGTTRTSIVWRNDTIVFTLISRIDSDILIKIAESVKKIK